MKKKNLVCYLVIFLFTFTYFGFLGNNYYIGDDTIFHTSNIIVMAGEISFTNLIPGRIMPTLVSNLGYGVNLFYPIFPHFIGAYLLKFLSLFGLGITEVMKLIHFMVIFLSGIFMYNYIFKVFKNRIQALMTAIIYQGMPYLFTDVFMRGALNESFLFMYLPIIFLSFHYLLVEDDVSKFYFYFVVGYSLFILTHLVLAVYLTILLILFLLVYYKKLFNKKTIMRLIGASGLVLLITSNFWGPLLEHKLLNNYYIFNLKYVDTMDVQITSILYYFFPLKFLKIKKNYYLLLFISPVCLFFMVCNYFLLYKKKVSKGDTRFLGGFLIIMVSSIFLACSSFIWQVMPNILKNIQFSWRLSLFVAFASACFGGYGIRLFNSKIQKILIIISIVLLASCNYYLSSSLDYEKIDDAEYLKDSCCNLQWSYEYLPSVAKYNSLYLYNKGERLELKGEAGSVKLLSNEVPNMEFEVLELEEEVKLEFPRIYYLGYELRKDTGEEVELYQNSFGLLETVIDEDGIYYLEYKGTILDRVTKWISLLATVGFSGYFLVLKTVKRLKYKSFGV